MITVRLGEPDQVTAGDTLKFRREEADYVPPTWTLRYVLVKDAEQIEFSSTDNGDGTHLINVAATTTDDWVPGTYAWQVYAESGSERFTTGRGVIEILPNFSALASGHDNRTHVKRTLDAIEAVIEERATKDQESYTINGRSLNRTPMEQLLMLRDKYARLYQQELDRQKVADGKTGKSSVYVRFRNVGL